MHGDNLVPEGSSGNGYVRNCVQASSFTSCAQTDPYGHCALISHEKVTGAAKKMFMKSHAMSKNEALCEASRSVDGVLALQGSTA